MPAGITLLGHVTWDGTNADELRSVAGCRFEGTWETSALIRNTEGHLAHVPPGWVVSAWSGISGQDEPAVMISAPGSWVITMMLARAAGLEAA